MVNWVHLYAYHVGILRSVQAQPRLLMIQMTNSLSLFLSFFFSLCIVFVHKSFDFGVWRDMAKVFIPSLKDERPSIDDSLPDRMDTSHAPSIKGLTVRTAVPALTVPG